jgi:hypothetical protein
MPVLVRRVLTWVLHNPVSAASTSRPADVPTPTTRTAGAVVKSAAISCPAESTNARDLVTRVYAELAKYVSMLAATVARSKRLCSALIVAMKSQATKSMPPRMVKMSSKNGLACSLAPTLVIALSIVVFTTARNLVMLKMLNPATALVLLTL